MWIFVLVFGKETEQLHSGPEWYCVMSIMTVNWFESWGEEVRLSETRRLDYTVNPFSSWVYKVLNNM
jgi:hypothetical protein